MAHDTDHRIEFARTLASLGNVPARERVADRLADALFDVDDVLAVLTAEDATDVRWLEPRLRLIYRQIDELMRTICD